MSYCDCEPIPNFPEVEEIIDEATSKFGAFLQESFTNEYKALAISLDKAIESNKKLKELLNNNKQKEQELQEREVNLIEKEKEQYEKFKEKWFAELGLNFKVGDTVYYYKAISNNINCPTCNGSRIVNAKIEGVNGTLLDCEIDCPTCDGHGAIPSEKEYEIIEAQIFEIKLCITQNDNSTNVEYENFYGVPMTYIEIRNKGDNISQCLRGDKLYKTREECKKSIEELY